MKQSKKKPLKIWRVFLAILALIVIALSVYKIYNLDKEANSRRAEYNMDFLDDLEVFTSADYGNKYAPVMAFKTQDFDELEKLAETALTEDEDPYDGYCETIRYFRNIGHGEGKKNRNQWLETVNIWLDKKPGSSVARIAKASILISYAWDARGGKGARSVSNENKQLFYQRLEKAKDVLLDVPHPDRKKYPQWYSCILTCARGLGVPDEQFDTIYAHAARECPYYVDFHFSAAHFTTPQWGGKPGEWEDNLRNAISHLSEDESSIVYACTIYRMIGRGHENREAYHTTMKPAKIDTGRLIKGLKCILEKRPDSVYYNNALAHAETEYRNDPIQCRNALKAAGWKIHTGIWQTEERFDYYCREWLERRFKAYNKHLDQEEKENSPWRLISS